MLRRPLSLLLLLALAASPAHAQWSLAASLGHAAVSGDAVAPDDPAHPTIHPFHPAIAELALARDLGAWRVQASFRAIEADLGVIDPEVAVLARGALSAVGGAVAISRRVAGAPRGGAVHIGAGVAFERWSLSGARRSRLLGQFSLEGDALLAAGWAGTVRLAWSGGGSLFHDADLPNGYRRKMENRITVGLGVRRLFG